MFKMVIGLAIQKPYVNLQFYTMDTLYDIKDIQHLLKFTPLTSCMNVLHAYCTYSVITIPLCKSYTVLIEWYVIISWALFHLHHS